MGNFERKEFKETLDEVQKLARSANRIAMVPSIVLPVAAVGGGLALFFGLGMLAKAFGYTGNILDDAKDFTSKAIFGSETYDDGAGEIYTGSIYRDPDTNEFINPLHNIPIAGGLFGAGIWAGSKHPAFQEYQRKRREEFEQYQQDQQAADQPFRDPDDNKLRFAEENYPTTYSIYIEITDPNSQYNYQLYPLSCQQYMLYQYRLLLAQQFNPNTPSVMGEIGALNDLYFDIFNTQLPAMPTSYPPPPNPAEDPFNPMGVREAIDAYNEWVAGIPVEGLDGRITYS